MTDQMVIGRFHASDGFCLERRDDTIVLLKAPKGVDPFDRTTSVEEIVLTPSEFASMVAHASRRGETHETWTQALALLEQPK